MTEHAKLNRDGALELPRSLIDAKGWQPGAEFEVEETAAGLLIRSAVASAVREGIDWDEFRHRVPKHQGPPVSLEDMQRGIDEAMAERWASKERNSR